jgi:acid stress-induced BolA-like protein IbaG/YrbA
MQPHEIEAAVRAAIADADVQVQVEGSHVHLVVVSPAFEGVSPVKKQQMVYGALNQAIADGSIHAVHMNTYTPAEWAQHQV